MDTEKIILDTIQAYEGGNVEVLEAFTKLKEIKKSLELSIGFIKAFETEHFQSITDSIKDYGGEFKGYSFEVRNGRKTFDYSNISEVLEAEKGVKDLKEYYKQAFNSHQKNILIATDDGEEIKLPTIKYAKGSIILKKGWKKYLIT